MATSSKLEPAGWDRKIKRDRWRLLITSQRSQITKRALVWGSPNWQPERKKKYVKQGLRDQAHGQSNHLLNLLQFLRVVLSPQNPSKALELQEGECFESFKLNSGNVFTLNPPFFTPLKHVPLNHGHFCHHPCALQWHPRVICHGCHKKGRN